MKTIGKFIKIKRTEKDYTLKEVAKLCNTTDATLSRIETGKVQPDYPLLLSLSKTLDFSLSEIDYEEERKEVTPKDSKELILSALFEYEKIKNKKDIPISIGNFALINWSREKMKIGEDACYVIPEEYKDISGCVYCYVREREALFFEEPNPYKEIEPGKTILANIADVFVPGKLRLVKDIKYIDTDCELLELSNGQIKGIFSFCVSERDY